MKKVAQYFFGHYFSGLDIEPCDSITFASWYESTHHDVTQMQLEAAFEVAKWIWTYRKKQTYYIVTLEGEHVYGGVSHQGIIRKLSDVPTIQHRIEIEYNIRFSKDPTYHRGVEYHNIINDERDITLVIRECRGHLL